MKTINKNTTTIIILLFISLVAFSESTENITVRSVMVPCMINKSNNPLLEIQINKVGENKISKLAFNIEGNLKPTDFINFSLILNNIEISNRFKIDHDEILFYTDFIFNDSAKILLRCNLKQETSIKSTFSVNAKSVTINTKVRRIKHNPLYTHRIGIAVRDKGTDSVNTYRIPGIAASSEGTLLAICDARYESARDLQGHMDIALIRSRNGGQNWEPMQIVLDMETFAGLDQKFNGVSDACILVDKNTNRIYIAGLWMHGVLDKNGKFTENLTQESKNWVHQWHSRGSQPGWSPRETCQFLITYSDDDGDTWSKPINITSQTKPYEWWLFAPAPGNGIKMRDGTLVFPTQGRDKNGETFSNITYSTDHGVTWKTSAPAQTNTTECAVVELNGTLMLNMRDNRNSKIKDNHNGRAVFCTNNMGKSWTKHPSSNNVLQEPVCMASLIKLEAFENVFQKDILLFSNPDSKHHRHMMTIKASIDNGNTWPENYKLMIDEGYSFGYSSLVRVDNETIGILYEGSRAQMCFQLIPIKDIIRKHKKNKY